MSELPLPTLPLADMRLSRWNPMRRMARHRLAEPAAAGASAASAGPADIARTLQPLPTATPIVADAGGRRSRTPAYAISWAREASEVREAQRLRYQVFAEEMGARLSVPAGTPAGLDVDLFDAHCEHLIVRAPASEDGEPGQVIGTYRVLTPQAARRVGGWYSETEFDLTRLRGLSARMAELGRSCVHPDHRDGGVVLALWGALGRFMADNGLDTMIGCASVGMRDGGHLAASLWEQLRHQHLAPIEHQVRARLPLPVAELRSDLPAEPPALIKGYLRCGAKILGAPAWDPDFNTADLPMMLRLRDLPAKYRKHFQIDATA